MEQEIKIFGASLDALSSPERVNLKLAYTSHLKNRTLNRGEYKDPYDFIKTFVAKNITLNDKIKWTGKISIPSRLTPKPKVSDTLKLSVDKFDQFLKNNGCWKYALMVADYINKKISPGMPVMIGVDHSLSGGSIMALIDRYPNLNIVILDSHFDVMDMRRNTISMFNLPNTKKMKHKSHLNYYECGNFLDCLLEREVISPKNLWILGVQDEIYRELRGGKYLREDSDLNAISIKKWMGEGVHVVFKHMIQSGHFKMDLNGPTYLSIDMDVGSMSSIYSARFMNSCGLSRKEFLQLLNKVSRLIEASRCPLVGLDIMEFDVHFFDVAKEKIVNDCTEQVIKEIFEIFLNKN